MPSRGLVFEEGLGLQEQALQGVPAEGLLVDGGFACHCSYVEYGGHVATGTAGDSSRRLPTGSECLPGPQGSAEVGRAVLAIKLPEAGL